MHFIHIFRTKNKLMRPGAAQTETKATKTSEADEKMKRLCLKRQLRKDTCIF